MPKYSIFKIVYVFTYDRYYSICTYSIHIRSGQTGRVTTVVFSTSLAEPRLPTLHVRPAAAEDRPHSGLPTAAHRAEHVHLQG